MFKYRLAYCDGVIGDLLQKSCDSVAERRFSARSKWDSAQKGADRNIILREASRTRKISLTLHHRPTGASFMSV